MYLGPDIPTLAFALGKALALVIVLCLTLIPAAIAAKAYAFWKGSKKTPKDLGELQPAEDDLPTPSIRPTRIPRNPKPAETDDSQPNSKRGENRDYQGSSSGAQVEASDTPTVSLD